jgi:hypothetical protein
VTTTLGRPLPVDERVTLRFLSVQIGCSVAPEG